MLVTSSYTPNADHDFPNATGLAANEVTGGSYARQNVASRTKTVQDGSDKYEHAANNVTFTALSSAAPKYAIIYRAVSADTDHQLVCWIDLGTVSVTGDFTVKWDGGATDGVIFELT